MNIAPKANLPDMLPPKVSSSRERSTKRIFSRSISLVMPNELMNSSAVKRCSKQFEREADEITLEPLFNKTLSGVKSYSINRFQLMKKAVSTFMKNMGKFNDENVLEPTMQEKVAIITEDKFLFRKLKEDLRERKLVTNFAVKEFLDVVFEGQDFAAKFAQASNSVHKKCKPYS